jgi:Subtilase family
MNAGSETNIEASEWANPFKGDQGTIELAQACRDPYLLWAIFNRNKNKGVWEVSDPPVFNIPVILQTVEKLEKLNGVNCKKDGAEIKNDYFAPLEPSLNGAHYCSAMVTAQFIQKPPEWVERLELSLPHSTEAFVVPKTVSSNTVNSVSPVEHDATDAPDLETRLPTIIGIIDDQFDFLNTYYAKDLAQTSTRFLAVWDQNDHVALQTGKVWLEADIDNHIQKFGRSYASYSGLNYPIKLRSHGVSVASIAIKNIAKCKPEVIDSEPSIVAVQLPSNTVVDTSGASLGAHALDAMHYIFNIAALHTPIAQTFKRPVVVNLSYGAIAGAHDGTSILESAMDELLALRADNTAIVLPAGNARESRTHLSADIEPNSIFEFNWTMPPADATDSFLELWVDCDSCIDVQVIPPYGAASSGWVAEDTMTLWQTIHGGMINTVGALINIGNSTNSNLHKQTLIALAPTKYSSKVPNALISAGIFKIQVKNKSSVKINMQAWVERDDAVLGFDGGGQQSTLSYINLAQQNANSLQEIGTLNNIANGKDTISVAAYTQSSGEPCNYSGESLTGAFRNNKLTVAAPGDEGEGPWRGLEVREALGSDTFRVGGTSLAAPAVTRWLADYMFNNITLQQPLTHAQIKQALEAQAVKDDKKKPAAPASRVGSGRLNV